MKTNIIIVTLVLLLLLLLVSCSSSDELNTQGIEIQKQEILDEKSDVSVKEATYSVKSLEEITKTMPESILDYKLLKNDNKVERVVEWELSAIEIEYRKNKQIIDIDLLFVKYDNYKRWLYFLGKKANDGEIERLYYFNNSYYKISSQTYAVFIDEYYMNAIFFQAEGNGVDEVMSLLASRFKFDNSDFDLDYTKLDEFAK